MLDQKRIGDHFAHLASFEKLSGTEGADQGARYILEKLEESGVPCHMEQFTGLVSNPVSARLTACAGEVSLEIPARPRSFSKEVSGLVGEAVFDRGASASQADAGTGLSGKIPVSFGFDERRLKEYERQGASAWIQVWESEEDILHEDTVSGVWGTPTEDTALLLPAIPVAGISRASYEQLLSLTAEGTVTLRLDVEMEEKAACLNMPAAHIKGKTDEFLLLSCHYDTWYEGAFDNCAANAAVLEIARALKLQQDLLFRSVRILWWSGHSNGRYAGSAWYCDKYFSELKKNCIGHITSDLIGCKGCSTVSVRSAGTEGTEFLDQVIRAVDPDAVIDRYPLGRGADQSFWGADIPIHFYTRYERPAAEKDSASPGPGVRWWHTAEDTVDKVDREMLRKDSEILYGASLKLLTEEKLPFDICGFIDPIVKRLEAELDEDAKKELDEAIWELKGCRTQLSFILKRADQSLHNETVKLAGGTLSRLFYSWGSPFEQDLAFPASGPLPKLFRSAAALNRSKGREASKEKLFFQTDFIRQKNRLTEELRQLVKQLTFIADSLT